MSPLLFFIICELSCRAFNLSKKFDADFKFYIRMVDNDVEIDYNAEDYILMWKPKPNYDDGFIKISSAGLRDKEYRIQKDSNVFRILCLGDSSTFGMKMPYNKIYPTLLEDKLNEEFGSQKWRFEVINAGVTGYASSQGLALYKYVGIKYQPNIVMFYFGINDPIKRFYLSDKQIMQEHSPKWYKSLMNNYLVRLHSYRLLRKIILTSWGNRYKKIRKDVARVSLNEFKSNIIELNKLCREHKAILVLISPVLCREKSSFRERTQDIVLYKKALTDVAIQYQIPLIQIREMSEQSDSPTEQYFLDKVHPNELGHKRIMEAIYDFLFRHDLLEHLKPLKPEV